MHGQLTSGRATTGPTPGGGQHGAKRVTKVEMVVVEDRKKKRNGRSISARNVMRALIIQATHRKFRGRWTWTDGHPARSVD